MNFNLGGRATAKEDCTQYIKGCEEILAENRKAGKLIFAKSPTLTKILFSLIYCPYI